ncbi:YchJ family protein [Arcicella rigui]|uniref:YchJ family protein n=1 Tax=Arcicella rigui TaxID=797020 RepID=A0ABU5QFN7_9BACT|nr:YchJ family protein [Arcicella rigui]MEA5141563.1 YchJ family protein [Arcicella rigui]
MMPAQCYCGSHLPFSECCEPIITGKKEALTAEALMRSRYSAYASIAPEYLMQSTYFSERSKFTEQDLSDWASENQWKKLEIISIKNGQINDSTGEVSFKAYFQDAEGKNQIHHEHSTFIKENGKWFYVKGIINPQKLSPAVLIGRNDPCICGSGKKYKKCCGV